jgi:hypothetical protein
MSLLLPVFILVATLIALIGSNRLQSNFRSFWLITVIGAGLTGVALLILRLRLPAVVSLPGWWAGQGLEFPLNFALTEYSWPLAFSLMALFTAGILVELRRPQGASWLPWAPGLALAAAGLLAVLSGDLLAYAFTFFLYDLLALALSFRSEESPLREHIRRFNFNTTAVVLLLIAWATPPSYAAFGAVAALAAAGLRLLVGVRLPAPYEKTRFDFYAILQFGAPVAALALLCTLPPLDGALQIAALIGLLAVAILAAMRWLSLTDETAMQDRRTALAALALASASAGAPGAVLGFGISLLLGHALLALPGSFPRLRLPLAALACLVVISLPFTPTHAALGLYAVGVPLTYGFLLPQAMLVAGMGLRLFAPRTLAADSVGGIERAGALLLPVVFLLFGFGFAPVMAFNTTLPIWPVAALAVLATLIFAIVRSRRQLLPPHFGKRIPRITLKPVGNTLWAGATFSLRLVSALLEGEAGVIWALLLIALLISFVGQLGFSG